MIRGKPKRITKRPAFWRPGIFIAFFCFVFAWPTIAWMIEMTAIAIFSKEIRCIAIDKSRFDLSAPMGESGGGVVYQPGFSLCFRSIRSDELYYLFRPEGAGWRFEVGDQAILNVVPMASKIRINGRSLFVSINSATAAALPENK